MARSSAKRKTKRSRKSKVVAFTATYEIKPAPAESYEQFVNSPEESSTPDAATVSYMDQFRRQERNKVFKLGAVAILAGVAFFYAFVSVFVMMENLNAVVLRTLLP